MSEWYQDMATKSKLSLLHKIFDPGLTQRCWRVQDRVIRSMLMKLRGGTAHFQVETGRWQGVAREYRVCRECDDGMIEDVHHWMLSCPVWSNQHQPIITCACEPTSEFNDLSTDVKVVVIVDQACRDHKIAKFLCVMWCACFS